MSFNSDFIGRHFYSREPIFIWVSDRDYGSTHSDFTAVLLQTSVGVSGTDALKDGGNPREGRCYRTGSTSLVLT